LFRLKRKTNENEKKRIRTFTSVSRSTPHVAASGERGGGLQTFLGLSSRSSLSLTLTHELQQQQQVEATRAFFFQLDRGYSNAPGQRLCNGETVFSFPRKNRKKYKLFSVITTSRKRRRRRKVARESKIRNQNTQRAKMQTL
jgi:hypothetical protein